MKIHDQIMLDAWKQIVTVKQFSRVQPVYAFQLSKVSKHCVSIDSIAAKE